MSTPSQPSPTNLSDELREKVNLVLEMRGVVKSLRGDSWDYRTQVNLVLDEIMSAITAAYAEAIKGCVPEKIDADDPDWVMPDNPQDAADQAWNAAIDTFTANLQKAGLLPTNGSDEGSADKPHDSDILDHGEGMEAWENP